MASPIQIVLNPENYEEAREAGGGGGRKDFFAHRDAEFVAHRNALLGQLDTISGVLSAQSQGDVGYVKVILRREAWAKSHRPVASLFRDNRTPVVGGGDLGVMIVEARPDALRQVAAEIARAETYTEMRFNEQKQKDEPNPSARKSETGAIDRIELYGPADRRSFSVEEAVAWLSNPMTGSGYQVELFDSPPPRSEWDRLDAGENTIGKKRERRRSRAEIDACHTELAFLFRRDRQRARIGRRDEAVAFGVAAIDEDEEIAQRSFVRRYGMEASRHAPRRKPDRIAHAADAVEFIAEAIEMQERTAVAFGIAFARRHEPLQIVMRDAPRLDVDTRRAVRRGEPPRRNRNRVVADRHAGRTLRLRENRTNDRLGLVEIGQHTGFHAARPLQTEARKPKRRLRQRRTLLSHHHGGNRFAGADVQKPERPVRAPISHWHPTIVS